MANFSYADTLAEQTPETMFKRYFTKKNLKVDWVKDFNSALNEVYEENPSKHLYEHCIRLGKIHLEKFIKEFQNITPLPDGYKYNSAAILTDLEELLKEHTQEVYKIDQENPKTPDVLKLVTRQFLVGFNLAKDYIDSHNESIRPQ